jgi:glycogen debranching enzyme
MERMEGMTDRLDADRPTASDNLAMVSELLSPEGWVYASSLPVEAGDPGRFHALFGRDSLIFALQVLTVRPEVATATLRALAALQGQVDDPETDEEPGKILHEHRPVAPSWLIEQGWPVRNGEIRYYGTSDATSWFLIVLDATNDAPLQTELNASWRAAGGWLERALDNGHGYVRCGPRRYPGGLAQQGWRDILNSDADQHGGGIVREDGSRPTAPMADADSQAAAVAALDALARLDPEWGQKWSELAAQLRARIQVAITAEVMALDADDRPVTGAGSQLGWMLWAGALDDAATAQAVDRLTSPDILTPYGVRTLAATHPAFLADGYHRGAIWPFDNWIAWGGLHRAGAHEHADQLRAGVQRALASLGRYPELYAVRDGELEAIPIANRVQAWTVGATVAFDANWDGRLR